MGRRSGGKKGLVESKVISKLLSVDPADSVEQPPI